MSLAGEHLRPRPRPRLVVNNEPMIEALELFEGFDRALLYFWLIGVDLDAGFEALAWSRIATRNDNGRGT